MADSTRQDPPIPILTVLEDVVDQVVGAVTTPGLWKVPAGGYLGCDWLTRKGCYRVTIDVLPDRAYLELHSPAETAPERAGG